MWTILDIVNNSLPNTTVNIIHYMLSGMSSMYTRPMEKITTKA